jgi:hypothetical protein
LDSRPGEPDLETCNKSLKTHRSSERLGQACSVGGIYETPSSATDPAKEPVNALAQFDYTNGSLTLTLYNLIADQRSVGQNLSEIYFSFGALESGAVTDMAGGPTNMNGYAGTVIVPPQSPHFPSADFWPLATGSFHPLGTSFVGFHLHNQHSKSEPTRGFRM